ncbi:hypothetical protein [Kutzneria sp. NPDC051319]|uniref:hypothetical protein n=1 Tax=Kutzneria sp. NPDC051319 TaxID=3155047 RepID=UPI0034422924
MAKRTAADVVTALGGVIAADLDSPCPTCVLCQTTPCSCPPFGTTAYFALVNRRHGTR